MNHPQTGPWSSLKAGVASQANAVCKTFVPHCRLHSDQERELNTGLRPQEVEILELGLGSGKTQQVHTIAYLYASSHSGCKIVAYAPEVSLIFFSDNLQYHLSGLLEDSKGRKGIHVK